MPRDRRSPGPRPYSEPGPFEAIVVSHLDPNYMGTLQVELLRKTRTGSLPERSGQLVEVRYLNPFYGVTPLADVSANDGYAYTQKSYGMWFVPPDVGSRVLVIFAEGDISQGFWIGCVQDKYMNFMVPDGRASTELTTEATPSSLRGKKLPVGEYNKRVETATGNDPTRFLKPYNKDFTQVLEVQGLIDDEYRGTTTTSARREVPSAVFGVSTPGPKDKRQNAPRGRYGQYEARAQVPVNRLGGSSFVMDDGDDKLLRQTSAGEGPPVYINKENGETGGDPTIPQNELMRLRTRTGHQILLHNSEDLIYIGNSRGTAWIELTSDGKIDIYASDSISVHSDVDLNFSASRDVNIEGGRNINMKASATWSDGAPTDSAGSSSGRVQMESAFDTNIVVERDMKIAVKNNKDVSVGEMRRISVGDSNSLTAGSDVNIASTTITNILAGASLKMSSGTNLSMTASGIIAGDAPQVYLRSGRAAPANAGAPAQAPERLTIHNVPRVDPGLLNYQSQTSIMKRVPQHEPWPHHENLNPLYFKPDYTDISNKSTIPASSFVITPDTFRKSSDAPGAATNRPVGLGPGATAAPGAQDPLSPGFDATNEIVPQRGTPGAPLSLDQLVGTINGLDEQQTAAYLGALGQRESNNAYDAVNTIGFAGKYQFGAAALEDGGYVVTGTARRGNRALNESSVWTGKNGVSSLQDWLANKNNCQELEIIEYTNRNRRTLINTTGGIRDADPVDVQAGMMMGAHLLGAGGITRWRNGGGGRDAYGTTGGQYYSLGVNAVRPYV